MGNTFFFYVNHVTINDSYNDELLWPLLHKIEILFLEFIEDTSSQKQS